MLKLISLLLTLALAASAIHAEGLWDKAKSATGSAVGVIGESAQNLGQAISGDEEDPATLRARIDRSAAEAIERLTAGDPVARERYQASAGYAVFDTSRLSLLITTGFGSGVAVDRAADRRTYMKMATGGLNLGYGVQSYRVVFLFPDKVSFDDFVTNGWTADAEATAAANEDTGDAALRLKNGVSVYKLDEQGVALSATLSGTKYWQDADLNP